MVIELLIRILFMTVGIMIGLLVMGLVCSGTSEDSYRAGWHNGHEIGFREGAEWQSKQI